VNTQQTDDGRPSEAETVVVADGDPALRQIEAQMLRRLGYRVLEAEGREEAMRLAAANPTIEFLLTDLGMTQANRFRQREADTGLSPGQHSKHTMVHASPKNGNP
jgi:CheY-like chemotaxis protein